MVRSVAVCCRVALLLTLAAVPACSSIGVRPVKRPALFGQWQASAPSCAGLSPRSAQTLRLYDLDHVYDRNPDEAAAKLHTEAVRQAQPDAVFALCELHCVQGCAAEKKRP